MTFYYRLNDQAVAQEDVDGEVIVVNFITGAYFSLRGTAADIWRLALGGASSDALADAAVAAWNSPETATQVRDFLFDLVALELMMPQEAPLDGALAPVFSGDFATPVIDKFEDMAEFIKLDPIHEVTSAGWPIANH